MMRYKILLLCLLFALNSYGQEGDNYLFQTAKLWGFVKYHYKTTAEEIDNDLFDLLDRKITADEFVEKYAHQNKKDKKEHFDSIYTVPYDVVNSLTIINEANKEKLFAGIDNRYRNYSFKGLYPQLSSLFKRKYYKELPYNKEHLSINEMYLGIFRLWNLLNYFYPYRYQIDNWDEVLLKSIENFRNNPIQEQYHEALKFIIWSLKDAHSELFRKYSEPKGLLYEDFSYNKFGSREFLNILPVHFLLDSPLIIRNIWNNIPLQINDTIISINGKTPFSYIKKDNPLDTVHKQLGLIAFKEDELKINLRRADKSIKVTLDTNHFITPAEWYGYEHSNHNPLPTIHTLEDKIGYINAGKLDKASFKKAKEFIKAHDTLLIDLRDYPKSNYTSKLIDEFFYTKKHPTHMFVFPLYKSPGKFKKTTIKNKGSYEGSKKIYVLINNFTVSWTEMLTINLLSNKDVELIGANTANGLGSVDFFLPLPGGIEFVTTDFAFLSADEENFYPTGIVPHKQLIYPDIEHALEYILNK